MFDKILKGVLGASTETASEEPEYDEHFGRRSHRPIPPVRHPSHREYAKKYAWFQNPERTAKWTLTGMDGLDLGVGVDWASYTYDDDEVDALSRLVESEPLSTQRRDAAYTIIIARMPVEQLQSQTELISQLIRYRAARAAVRLADRLGERWVRQQADELVLLIGGADDERADEVLLWLDEPRREEIMLKQFAAGDSPAWKLAALTPTGPVIDAAIDWLRREPAYEYGTPPREFLSLGEPLYDAVVDLERQDCAHRRLLVEALARSSRPEAAERLGDYLADSDDDVQRTALESLRRLGRAAIPVGARWLEASRKAERLMGVQILDAYELDAATIEVARSAQQKERTAQVREALEDLLRPYEDLTPEDLKRNTVRQFLRDSDSWRERQPWEQPNDELRESAMRALDELGDSGIEHLTSEFDAADIEVRKRALEILLDLRPDDLEAILRRELKKQRSEMVRTDIALALCANQQTNDVNSLDSFLAEFALVRPTALAEAELPPLVWNEGSRLSDPANESLLSLLETARRKPRALRPICEALDRTQSSATWHAIREAIGAESAEVRVGWVLYSAPLLATSIDVARLARGLNQLISEGYHQQVGHIIDVLRLDGSAESIGRIEHWSRKAKTRDFQRRCTSALEQIANERGWTREQLLERTFPQFGFDETGTRRVPFGARGELTLTLSPEGDVTMTDDTGKVWERYPGELQDDDPEKYAAAKAALVALRREIRSGARLVAQRLEEAMIAQRQWERSDFEAAFLDNPFAFRLASSVVWRCSLPGEEQKLCRLSEDRTLADIDDELIDWKKVPRLRIAHPVDMDEQHQLQWAEKLSDYEIVQCFDQVDRPVLPLNPPLRTQASGDQIHSIARRIGFLPQEDSWISEYTRRLGEKEIALKLTEGFHVSAPESARQEVELVYPQNPDAILASELALLWQNFVTALDSLDR